MGGLSNLLAQAVQNAVPEIFDNEEECGKDGKPRRTFAWHLRTLPQELRPLYDDTAAFILSLGDDVNAKELRRYLAFTRLKNFICLLPMKNGLKLWLNLPPDSVEIDGDFIRDMRGVGHWGTGDLQVYIRDRASLEKAKPLLERAYTEN